MRSVALLAGALLVLVAAGCGSGSVVAPTARTVVGELPKPGKGDAAKGKQLYVSLGCNACHTLDGARSAGPTFKNLAGKQEKLDNGQSVKADDEYLVESITDPDKLIAAGYQRGIMTSVIKPGQVSQSDAASLVAFIKTVK